MSQWTDSARSRLDSYSSRVREEFGTSGVDGNEVAEDLRRHVQEELAGEKLPVVTEQDVERVLRRIGTPAPSAVLTEDPPPEKPREEKAPTEPPQASFPRPGWWLLIFGGLLPLGTIIFEYITGACAAVLFNPLPTWGHILLTTLVPVSNTAVWLALRQKRLEHLNSLRLMSGMALAVSLIYMLLFLPFTPFAFIGIIVYGLGLVPLAPFFSFLCCGILTGDLQKAAHHSKGNRRILAGFGVALASLILLAVPMYLTTKGLKMAASTDPVESAKGVRLLRSWGQDEEVLRACYGRPRAASNDLFDWQPKISSELARTIYYRVTGQPFNAVPPPKLYAGRGRWSVIEDEFTWDNDQAGDAVGARVSGLSMMNSRQDGFIDPDGSFAYLEWTLEFKNTSRRAREARAQVLLPPGAVVSRLTLWVNGEEQEAAFGGRSQVSSAYKAVVQQRRDPVLVTTCGPDRILVQCFPVPVDGTMKARLGITAPLQLMTKEAGLLAWPRFLERNFTLGTNFQHSLWIQSQMPLSTGDGKLRADRASNGKFGLHGELSDIELAEGAGLIRAQRNAGVPSCWTKDLHSSNAIVQTVAEIPSKPAKRIVVVLDSSRGMHTARASLAKALTAVPAGHEVAILLARDGCEKILGITKTGPDSERVILEALRKIDFDGGHDNLPALVQAWDLAAEADPGIILWLHGSQPLLMDSGSQLRQRFDWRADGPKLVDFQITPGPNRVLETLDGVSSIRLAARMGGVAEDLRSAVETVSTQTTRLALRRERRTLEEARSDSGPAVSEHLSRLWAAEEIRSLAAKHQPEQAARMAVLYQLVTPVSGAVVLETAQQYAQAGLTPVPAETVPSVPEPSSLTLLVLMGLGAWGVRARLMRTRQA